MSDLRSTEYSDLLNNDPEYLYYHFTLSHQEHSDRIYEKKDCIYKDQLALNFIDHADQYEMAIDGFKIPTRDIPIGEWPVYPNSPPWNNTVWNLTEYRIGLEYLATTYATDVTIVQHYPGLPPVPIPLVNNGAWAYNDNFRIESITQLLVSINAAYAAAYALILVPPPGSAPPTFTYNSATKLISLNVNPLFYDDTNPNGIRVQMSMKLYNDWFRAFDVTYGQYIFGAVSSNPSAVQFNIPAASTIITQDYQTVHTYNTINHLHFISELMPGKSEYINSQDLSTQYIAPSVTKTKPILSTFVAEIDDLADINTPYVYFPNQRRWINLDNSTAIANISVSIQMASKLFGPRYMQVWPGDAFIVKLVFRRKVKQIIEQDLYT